jgi:Mg-chelatase subunit ChlI
MTTSRNLKPFSTLPAERRIEIAERYTEIREENPDADLMRYKNVQNALRRKRANIRAKCIAHLQSTRKP